MPETVGEVLTAFRHWLQAAASLDDIALLDPAKPQPADGAALLLAGLERAERPRSDAGDPTIEAALLILVGGADAAATLGGEVMFALHDERWTDAAGAQRPLRVDSAEAADRVRHRLGLPATLAMLVRIPIRRQRQLTPVRAVLQRLRLELEDMSALEGVVVGEIDGRPPQPVAHARIEAPDYGRFATSDAAGRFRIAGLPVGKSIALTVTARQQVHMISVEARSGVVLRLPGLVPTTTPSKA
jgi:hypothetical protein